MKINKTPNDTRCDATGNLQSRTTYHCMDVGSRVTQEAKANDAMDYRIGRSGGSLGNRSYYLEGEHLESEYAGATLQARYFRGSSTDELVAAWLLDSDGKTKAYLFHHDQVNSVSQVTGHNGGTTQAISYSAFGQTHSSSGSSPNRLKYTGREDDGSGLYYYRARYYDPQLGRFISEDPLGFQAGINFYAYVANNPVNGNDPSGLIDLIYQSGASSPTLRNTPDISSYNRYVVDISTFSEIPIGPLESVSTPISQVVNASTTANIIRQSSAPHHGELSSGSGIPELAVGGFTVYNYKSDFNATYGNTALYVLQGEAYRSDYIGNYIFGDIAASKNVALNTALTGSNYAQYATNFLSQGVFEGDEFRDVEAVTRGYLDYQFGNTVGNAAGGFLLYPNKQNSNMMQSVYSK